MFINQFLKRARSYLDERIAIHLIGSSGIGKSDATHQLRQQESERDGEEWGIATINLATETPPDVNGYLMGTTRDIVDKDGKKQKVLISEFSMPPHMMSDTGRPMNSYKRGFVFFDERGQADPDVKKAAAPVLLEGRAGQHHLHQGIGIISASNSREHRSGTTREFDFVINRETQWTIRPHLPSWLDFAYRNGVDPLFVTYAETHPTVVFADAHPETQGPWCTPRSFVRFTRILAKDYFVNGRLAVTPDNRADILEEGAGMLGVPAIEDLITWARVQTDVPTPEEVAKSPATALLPSVPDAQLLCVYMLAAAMNKKNGEAFVDYVLRLPPEWHPTYATAAIRRDKSLAALPAMNRKLAAKNATMINLLAQL